MLAFGGIEDRDMYKWGQFVVLICAESMQVDYGFQAVWLSELSGSGMELMHSYGLMPYSLVKYRVRDKVLQILECAAGPVSLSGVRELWKRQPSEC